MAGRNGPVWQTCHNPLRMYQAEQRVMSNLPYRPFSTEIQHSRRISLTLALARRHQELTVLRVVHVEQHRRAQHRLRLGTLTAFEQRRA